VSLTVSGPENGAEDRREYHHRHEDEEKNSAGHGANLGGRSQAGDFGEQHSVPTDRGGDVKKLRTAHVVLFGDAKQEIGTPTAASMSMIQVFSVSQEANVATSNSGQREGCG
jgi:hypothetical protein